MSFRKLFKIHTVNAELNQAMYLLADEVYRNTINADYFVISNEEIAYKLTGFDSDSQNEIMDLLFTEMLERGINFMTTKQNIIFAKGC